MRELDRLNREVRLIECATFELGLTDEADPWCIVHDGKHDIVVVHIARLERRYLVLVPPNLVVLRTTRIEAAVDSAISEVRRLASHIAMAG